MKQRLLPVLAAVLAEAVAFAQMRITSLDSGGTLTWTNSVTNALYRVQWGTSASGQWHPFDVWTNLNSIQANSNRVTVNLPISSVDAEVFYRVIWGDAPSYAGLYDIQEYDTDGTLLVTGWLWVAGEHASTGFEGTRSINQVGGPANYSGPQLGTGAINGGFSASYAEMNMNLTPNAYDNNVTLDGFLVGNTYQGTWEWNTGGIGPDHSGPFTAVRRNADKPAAPDAQGVWAYRTYTAGMYATGQVSFATSTNQVAGGWTFTNDYPSLVSSHLLGQGGFTNALVSGNRLTVTIPTASAGFVLDGQMAGNFYAGFARWATNGAQTGLFLAKKEGLP